MDRRVDFVTVATRDLDTARRFYVGGLGWQPLLDVPGEILFFQVGHGLVLGLFDRSAFDADLGRADPAPVGGFTLSHNVSGPDDVSRVLAEAESAGALIVKPAQGAAFGGVHGHFAGPDGVIWEVAYNPGWRVEDDGTVRLDAATDT